MASIAVTFLFVVLLVFPQEARKPTRIDPTWKIINVCGANLSIPPDMDLPHPGELGLDSCVELIQNASIRIVIETDPFPFASSGTDLTEFPKFESKPQFTRTKLRVDSREAILVTYFDEKDSDRSPYKAAMSVRAKGGLRLSASMRSETDWETAKAILLSLSLKQPAARPLGSFELKIGGMPGSDRFFVQLDLDRTLSVVKESLPITASGLTKKSFKRILDKGEANHLLSLAIVASDLDVGCDSAADGTNVSLVVSKDGQSARFSCRGATAWPVGPKIKAFISDLNSHLPKSLRVF
jgi:hypothetical protein